MNCATQHVKRSFMDRMFQARDTKLPALQKLCLLTLALRTGNDNSCWPSLEQIADDMGCSRRSVIRAISELEAAGMIIVHRSLRENGKPAPNQYQIAIWNSVRVAPLQCQSVTPIVTESHQVSDRESLEERHLRNTEEEKRESREREKTVAPATNVVDFSTWATPVPLESEETPQVVFKGDGSLHANDTFRRFWLPDFDDDHHQLDLAIIQATPYVQPNTSKPLEALLSSQLARQVRDRKAQDARYNAARSKSDDPKQPSIAEAARLFFSQQEGRA